MCEYENVSFLCIFMYICVCMCTAPNTEHEILENIEKKNIYKAKTKTIHILPTVTRGKIPQIHTHILTHVHVF